MKKRKKLLRKRVINILNSDAASGIWRPLNKSSGFSLIELMVAVSIVAILAGLVVPKYNDLKKTVKKGHGKSVLLQLYQLEKMFFREFASYSARLDQVGFQSEGRMYYFVGFDNDFQAVGGVPPGTATCIHTCRGNGAAPACSFAPGWTCDPSATRLGDGSVPAFANVNSFLAVAHAHLDETVNGGTALGAHTWTINQNGIIVDVPNPN